MTWTAAAIGYAIYAQVLKRRCALVVPNCYHTGFEADLLGLTSDGRLIDIEVKVSRADLRADYSKDKWWLHRSWFQAAPDFVGPHRAREWPRGIWKHYYALPREVWTPELVASIPPASGVITLEADPYRLRVERRAKPNRAARSCTLEEAMHLAALCSGRMWEALTARDAAVAEMQHYRASLRSARASLGASNAETPG